jgi:hypothetical protein
MHEDICAALIEASGLIHHLVSPGKPSRRCSISSPTAPLDWSMCPTITVTVDTPAFGDPIVVTTIQG